MKNISIYSIICIIIFSMTSCKKDIDMIVQTDVGIPPVVESKGSMAGVVTNVTGQAIADVLVDINGQTTLTNEDGVYILNDIFLNQRSEKTLKTPFHR